MRIYELDYYRRNSTFNLKAFCPQICYYWKIQCKAESPNYHRGIVIAFFDKKTKGIIFGIVLKLKNGFSHLLLKAVWNPSWANESSSLLSNDKKIRNKFTRNCLIFGSPVSGTEAETWDKSVAGVRIMLHKPGTRWHPTIWG